MKNFFRTAAIVVAAMSLAAAAGAQEHNRAVLPTDTFDLPGGGRLEIGFIKHGSLTLNYNGHVIYCDPATLFPKVKDFKVKYDTLDKADLILVTHSHRDHLDPLAIKDLLKAGGVEGAGGTGETGRTGGAGGTGVAGEAGGQTLVLLNRESAAMVDFGSEMDNGDVRLVGDWVTITAVPSANLTPERAQYHPNDGRNNGYIMEFPGGFRVYFPGDIDYVPDVVCDPRRPVDVAFFPMNQPTTMTVEIAAEQARRLNPKVLYPIHFNDTPVGQLTELLKGTGIDVRIRQMQ